MKKLSRILIPLLVLSVVLCCFVAITSAEDAASTPAYRVTPINADGTLDTANATTYEGKDFTAFFKEKGTVADSGNNVYSVANLQVDLLSDVEWAGSDSLRNSGKFVLNLNGYTLTMKGWAADTAGGRINLQGANANFNDTVFTINGRADGSDKNGSIVASNAHNYIYMTPPTGTDVRNVTLDVYGVDFYSEATTEFSLFELRFGLSKFTNCNFNGKINFNLSGNAGYFHAKALFDGCVINSTAGSVFKTGKSGDPKNSATIVFNDGVINATSDYLFYVNIDADKTGTLYASQAARFTDENGDQIKNRSLTVTNSTINMPNASLVRCVNAETNIPNVINLGLGTRILMSDSTVGDAVNTTLTTPAGSVNAQCGPNEKEYMIVNSGDVVTVNFYNSMDEAEPFATRTMAKGVEPCIVGQLYIYLEQDADGKYTLKRFGGWKDIDGNPVTTLDGDVNLYRAEDVTAKYATYSTTTPSLDSIVHAEFEDNNIYGCFVSPVVLVQLYQDCAHTAENNDVILMPGAMTIDLNGHALTHGGSGTDFAFRPENVNRQPLTVKNGTVILDKSRFVYTNGKSNGSVTFTDVTFYMTGNAPLMETRSNYDHTAGKGGHTFRFTGVTVIVNNGGKTVSNDIFNLDRGGNYCSNVYVFDDFTLRTDDGSSVINVFENSSTKTGDIINFTLKNSTIDIPLTSEGAIFNFHNQASTAITITDTDINTYGNGKLIVKAEPTGSSTTEITVSGLNLDNSALWTESLFPSATFTVNGAAGAPIVVYGGNASMPYTVALESQYETVTWKFHNYSFKSLYKDGVTPKYYGDGIIFATTGEGKNLAGVVEPDWSPADVTPAVGGRDKDYTLELKLFTYTVTDAEGNILSHSFDTVIDGELFANLAAGNVLVLYSEIDAQCTQDITISPAKANTTLDLNGWILKNVYFKVQGSTTFNVKNGKLTSTNNSIFQLTTSSSKVNLNNVKCETGTGIIVDYRNGTLVAEDSNFTTNASVMSIGTQGTWVNARFEDCTFNAGAHFIVHNKAQNQSATIGVGVSVKGGSITAGNSLFYVGDREPFADSTFTLNFQEGVKINVKSGKYFNMMYDVAETVTFTNCWLNADPNTYVEGTVKPNVVYGAGMTLRSTTDNTYLYRLTDYKLPVSVNLTLFSDFNFNLFINGDILAVYADDNKLVLENDNDYVKAALSGISADRAAENVKFTIVYNDGGIGVVLTRNYSILDYASALLVSDYSKDSKELIASIVRYIDAAYAYGGKQNDDLTGFLAANPGYLDAISTAESLPDLDALVSDAEYKDLAIAIDSAQLALSGDLKYILNLKESYTGTLTVNGESYSVTDGKYNGKSYVVIKLAAKDYLDGLTVTATVEGGDDVIGNYDLVAYAVNMRGTKGDTLDDLLANLIAYVTEAKAYADFVAANGGNLI